MECKACTELCGELCPYTNVFDLAKPIMNRPLVLTENFQIIAPCDNINKNFFGIKSHGSQAYYNNMEVPYLMDAIEFVINEKNTSLEDILKLTKIKSQLQ